MQLVFLHDTINLHAKPEHWAIQMDLDFARSGIK
jgi:hypothetical protein